MDRRAGGQEDFQSVQDRLLSEGVVVSPRDREEVRQALDLGRRSHRKHMRTA